MKIAIIDSGIHAGHPHVVPVAGGVGVTPKGLSGDFVDRLGHGTAVAGAIREKVPDAELYAVKVFDQRLSTNIDSIVRAFEWCIEHRMDVINLSLGTANEAHRQRFERIISPAMLIVAAAHILPGTLPGVIAVAPEEDCPRDVYRYRDGVFHASPYPRAITGVPVQFNLQGASFAVANMTGFAARALERTSTETIRDALVAQAASHS
ncbi:MAG TPA: S8 family serine peptidase [Bryobacteraceae bacterium]|jgi:hypothetical protein|nr:S8 family serine peptidase [Bryobacteraceae bacterium]